MEIHWSVLRNKQIKIILLGIKSVNMLTQKRIHVINCINNPLNKIYFIRPYKIK